MPSRKTPFICSTMFRSLAIASLAWSAHASALAVAAPPQDIVLSYDVSTTIDQPITNIIKFNDYEYSSGAEWPDSLPAGGGLMTDPFTKSSSDKPLSGLILGLTANLPGDADGQQHLVIMMSNEAASLVHGVAFGTVSPTYTEEQVIYALQYQSGVSRTDANATEWDAQSSLLGDFTQTTLKNILGPGGSTQSAWFSLGAVVPGTTTVTHFSVVAFSDGQLIGTGTARLQALSSVPEPGAVGLTVSGLLVAGLAARRRSRTQAH